MWDRVGAMSVSNESDFLQLYSFIHQSDTLPGFLLTWPCSFRTSAGTNSSYLKYSMSCDNLCSQFMPACYLRPRHWMVSVIQQFVGLLTVSWVHSCCVRWNCNATECQAELSLQRWPQWNTAIHLQGFRPSFILVAALTILHSLKRKKNKQVW